MSREIHSGNAHLELVGRIRRLSQLLGQLCAEYEDHPNPATLACIEQRIMELADVADVLEASCGRNESVWAQANGSLTYEL